MERRGDNVNELIKISEMMGITQISTGKREDYLEWEEYFMGIAMLTAQRSKDPVTQVGACIINEDKHIVGIGYNGFPQHCSDDNFPWCKSSSNPLDNKNMNVCHAEVNAILNKSSIDVKGCDLYVALFPCNERAKIIVQSKIKEVIYLSDKNADKPQTIASKRMFDAAQIKFRQFIPKHEKIIIDFSSIRN